MHLSNSKNFHTRIFPKDLSHTNVITRISLHESSWTSPAKIIFRRKEWLLGEKRNSCHAARLEVSVMKMKLPWLGQATKHANDSLWNDLLHKKTILMHVKKQKQLSTRKLMNTKTMRNRLKRTFMAWRELAWAQKHIFEMRHVVYILLLFAILMKSKCRRHATIGTRQKIKWRKNLPNDSFLSMLPTQCGKNPLRCRKHQKDATKHTIKR